ncbi:Uncharacterised protein [Legionella lansingensis]|nr:Uncharacterised protein [Legionella lansingensis]
MTNIPRKGAGHSERSEESLKSYKLSRHTSTWKKLD